MNGVEILAIEEVAIKFDFNWMAFWITLGVIFAIFIAFGIYMSICHYDWSNLLIGVIVGTLIGGIFGVIMGVGLKTPIEYENQYKVIISDEVSMNEFTEKYEIIDQEGKIYTVKERE